MFTDYGKTILILASNFGYRNERYYTIQAVTSKVPIRHCADADAHTDRHLSCLHMLKCICYADESAYIVFNGFVARLL